MSNVDNIIELAGYKRSSSERRRGTLTKYDLFCHPLFFPNNMWVWRFVPGVLFGFFGGMLLFSKRLRKEAPPKKRGNSEGTSSVNSNSNRAAADVKLMLVVNGELKAMRPGKMGAQCGHAAAMAMKKLVLKHQDLLQQWEQCGQKKICVKGDSTAQLEFLCDEAQKAGLLVSPVFDAGKTQVEQGSFTVVAIGPAESDVLHPITGNLKLMS